MKLTTSLSIKDKGIAKHVNVEIDLDDQVPYEDLTTRTKMLITALQQGIADSFTQFPMNQIIDVTPSNRIKRPLNVPASEKQKKYLTDLLITHHTTLKQWCKTHNISETEITSSHCKEWIPELRKKKNFD